MTEAAETQSSWYEEVLDAERFYTVHGASGEHLGNAFLRRAVPEHLTSSLIFKKFSTKASVQAKTGKPRAVGPSWGQRQVGAAPRDSSQGKPKEAATMSEQDRLIDVRLAGIEKDLDNRMAAMQRYQEQADGRMEKAVDKLHQDYKATRATVVTTSVASALAVVGLVAAISWGAVAAFQSTVSEQGAWLRQSVERIELRLDARPAPAPAPSVESRPAPTPDAGASAESIDTP